MSDPTREEVDAMPGTTILEFGTSWCGHCQAARPIIDNVLAAHRDARYVRIEDGKGQRLGRSFRVKLWPTVVVLRDGVEIGRVTRPRDEAAMRAALG